MNADETKKLMDAVAQMGLLHVYATQLEIARYHSNDYQKSKEALERALLILQELHK